MKHIALVYGGKSAEHEVSCVSAGFVYDCLQEAGFQAHAIYIDREGHWYRTARPESPSGKNLGHPTAISPAGMLMGVDVRIDVVFPLIHGTQGEDGTMQGFCKMIDLPVTGPDVLTSSVCMDKSVFRDVMAGQQIPQTRYVTVERPDTAAAIQTINAAGIGYPLFTKPANAGSSLGIRKVKNPDDLPGALEEAFRYDDHVLLEDGRNVRELEVAILGVPGAYRLSEIAEIIPHHEFYTYEAKYEDDKGATLEAPAAITPQLAAQIREMAARAFLSVRGHGFARVDFFLDKDSGELLINEINTLPGFTPISMFPRLWSLSGLNGPALVAEIVRIALDRHERRIRF